MDAELEQLLSRWVEIGEGTHSVFMESNRWQVFSAVQSFLDERPTRPE